MTRQDQIDARNRERTAVALERIADAQERIARLLDEHMEDATWAIMTLAECAERAYPPPPEVAAAKAAAVAERVARGGGAPGTAPEKIRLTFGAVHGRPLLCAAELGRISCGQARRRQCFRAFLRSFLKAPGFGSQFLGQGLVAAGVGVNQRDVAE